MAKLQEAEATEALEALVPECTLGAFRPAHKHHATHWAKLTCKCGVILVCESIVTQAMERQMEGERYCPICGTLSTRLIDAGRI